MTPEREAELFAKIDMLINVAGRMEEKVAALDVKVAALDVRVAALDVRVVKLAEDVSEIKGRLAATPQAPEFYELRGRVEEISRRLPVSIAYSPPTGKATTGGSV